MYIIAERPDRFVIGLDRTTGIARANLTGFWSVDDLAAFYPAIAQALALSKARHDHALALVDATRSNAMSAMLIENLQSSKDAFFAAGGRVALVLSSGLLKRQSRRLMTDGWDLAYFPGTAEAEAWLIDAPVTARLPQPSSALVAANPPSTGRSTPLM